MTRGRGQGSKSRGSRPQHQRARITSPSESLSLDENTDTPLAPPSASTLLDQSRLTSDQWYHSEKTRKGYAGYVKSGKKWLEDWDNEGRTEGGVMLSGSGLGSDLPPTLSTLAGSFDVINENTPIALQLLTAYKCEHLGRGFSTAEGIRSAFKDFFERVHGCQGDTWRFNELSKKWEGNPVFQNDFKVYYESLKNRDNRTSTTVQALPIHPNELKTIFAYLDGPDGSLAITETQRLYFKAFATTAFTLWSRIDELINLQIQHVRLNQVSSSSSEAYHEFNLIFRKTNKDPTKGQVYHVPAQAEMPEIDCFSHLNAWTSHMSSLLPRPLQGDDFVFPALASTGRLKFGESISRSGFETLMGKLVENSGILKGRNGRYTTHCFRRGGAQFRFMWASHKWSLKAVKWWGGWSSNENVGTVMRYLLDELMAYEEGYTDIMMGDRHSERHETFMGGPAGPPVQITPTSQVSAVDLSQLQDSITTQIQELLTPLASRFMDSTSLSSSPPLPAPRFISPPLLPSPSPTPSPSTITFPPNVRPPSSSSSPSPPSTLPPRIPIVHTMDDILRLWNKGDPSKGVDLPLSEWEFTYESREYTKSEAMKLSNIRIIFEEFAITYKGDALAFRRGYPGLWEHYTKLLHRVRQARIARGETKSRKRKRNS